MRLILISLALASLPACQDQSSEASPIAPTVAAVSYDGADASERAALLAHGERLTKVLGCRGCHGEQLQGELFADVPGVGAIHASNLTIALQRYDSAGIEAALREGRRPDGSELWAMPSEMYTHLGQADMSALIAYLRSLSAVGTATPPKRVDEGWRADIASGRFKSSADYIAEQKGVAPADLGPTYARARMIAMTACTECHAAKLEGGEETPNLDIVGAYSAEQFATLMRTGKPVSGKELPMMSGVARGRFTHLTNSEVAELHAYLKARAERSQ